MDSIKLDIPKTDRREPECIIGMRKSQDETMLAIISGRTLIDLEQKQTSLFILKREKNSNF